MKFKIVFITILLSLTSLTNCAAASHIDQYEELLNEVRKEEADKAALKLKLCLSGLDNEVISKLDALSPVQKCLPCGCNIECSKKTTAEELLKFYTTNHKCKKKIVNQVIPVTPVQQKPAQRVNAGANLVQCLPMKSDKPEHVEIDFSDESIVTEPL